jgi:predicted nucleotidyltransferase
MQQSKALTMRLPLFAAAFTMIAFGQDTAPLWEVEVRAGKTAFAFGNYPMAVQRYQEALKQAEAAGASDEALIPILQALAIALRTDNKAAGSAAGARAPSRGHEASAWR